MFFSELSELYDAGRAMSVYLLNLFQRWYRVASFQMHRRQVNLSLQGMPLRIWGLASARIAVQNEKCIMINF